MTYYTCEPNYDEPLGNEDLELGLSSADQEWDHYTLPRKENKSKKTRTQRGWGPPDYTQEGWLPLDTRLPSNDAVKSDAVILHYLDAQARGPVMTRSVEDDVTFPLLGDGLREEPRTELRRNKWPSHEGMRSDGWCRQTESRPSCYSLNGGGGGKHAGKMWQSKIMSKDVGPGGSDHQSGLKI